MALLALGLGMLINQVIGAAWVRPRPYDVISGVNLLTAPSADPSFPSDHATAAFSLALGIGVASRSLKTILFGQALLLGLARVAVGLHYPTDIAAGLCVGLSSAAIADVAVTTGRYRLHQATSSIVGWAVPVGAPARRDGRPRLALASGGLFAVLLGMPAIVEAAADPVRFQPEWLEWVSLMVLAVLLGAVWLALTRFAMKAQTRSARPAAARAEAG